MDENGWSTRAPELLGRAFGGLPGAQVCQMATFTRGLSTGVQRCMYKVHGICGGAFPQRLTLLAWCPGRHPLQRRYVLYHPHRLLAVRPASVCCTGASQRGKPAGHLVLDMRGQIALAACCIIIARMHKTGGTEECAHTPATHEKCTQRPSQAGLETTGQTGRRWAVGERLSGVCWKRPETLQQMPRRSDKEKKTSLNWT